MRRFFGFVLALAVVVASPIAAGAVSPDQLTFDTSIEAKGPMVIFNVDILNAETGKKIDIPTIHFRSGEKRNISLALEKGSNQPDLRFEVEADNLIGSAQLKIVALQGETERILQQTKIQLK